MFVTDLLGYGKVALFICASDNRYLINITTMNTNTIQKTNIVSTVITFKRMVGIWYMATEICDVCQDLGNISSDSFALLFRNQDMLGPQTY